MQGSVASAILLLAATTAIVAVHGSRPRIACAIDDGDKNVSQPISQTALEALDYIHDEVGKYSGKRSEMPRGGESTAAAPAGPWGRIRVHVDYGNLKHACWDRTSYAKDMQGGYLKCYDSLMTPDRESNLKHRIIPRALDDLTRNIQVQQLQKPLKVGTMPGICANFDVPEELKTQGKQVDLIVFVAAPPTHYGGWATYCGTTDAGRPSVAVIALNTAYMRWSDYHTQSLERGLVMHEIMHGMGFMNYYLTSSFYSASAVSTRVMSTTVRGGMPVSIQSTPEVTAKAREYFNCSTAKGMELENEGGGGTRGSHWNRRNAFDDVMGPMMGIDTLSNITLAFFADCQHYRVTFQGEKSDWGKNAGCPFLDEKCNTVASGLGKYWCGNGAPTTSPDGYTCSYNRKAIGRCWTYTGSDSLPSYYQYFANDTKKRGGASYMDMCPTNAHYYRCSFPKAPPAWQVDLGYTYGFDSRCIKSNVSKGSPYYYGPKEARCFNVRCLDHNRRAELELNGVGYVACPADGSAGTVAPPAPYSGTIECPSALELCGEPTGPNVVPTTDPTAPPVTTTSVPPPTAAPPQPPATPAPENCGAKCRHNNHCSETGKLCTRCANASASQDGYCTQGVGCNQACEVTTDCLAGAMCDTCDSHLRVCKAGCGQPCARSEHCSTGCLICTRRAHESALHCHSPQMLEAEGEVFVAQDAAEAKHVADMMAKFAAEDAAAEGLH